MNKVTVSHLELTTLQRRLQGALEHVKATPNSVEVNKHVAIVVLERSIATIDEWLTRSVP